MNLPTYIREGLIIGVTQAITLIILLMLLTFAFGNQQATATKYAKATACELAVPSDPITGRNPALVAQCFTSVGLEPPLVIKIP